MEYPILFKKALRAAFPCTLPVMAGYLFVGFTFGLLMRHGGQSPVTALLMSVAVYAGSMQFVTIGFLAGGHGLLEIALMTLLINARHMFYGISFIEKFKGAGRKKPYMIFSLTDETFSLLCSAKAPEGVESTLFLFCAALLDQCYWVMGTAAGSLAGAALAGVDIRGIDFAMTALFVSIAADQWKAPPSRAPSLLGVGASLAALLLFGAGNFILPAMLAIVALLFIFRKPIEKKYAVEGGGTEADGCRAQDTR
jgi:4-azaleucine resistance transporter AzlC